MVRPKGKNQVIKAQKAIQQACGFRDQSPHPFYWNINISHRAGAPTTQKAVLPDPQPKYCWVCSGHKVQGKAILFFCYLCVASVPLQKKVLARNSAEMLISQLGSPTQTLRPPEREHKTCYLSNKIVKQKANKTISDFCGWGISSEHLCRRRIS